jgi:2-dehydropantoate 2-reductase
MPLIGRDTAILFAQNGIPWWYFHGVSGPLAGTRLESVDPGGEIWNRIGPERALGCVVWQAAEIEAPGIISHHYGDRMPIGEPTGEKTERAARLSRLLTSAGIKSPVRQELRNEIWLKLWGNLSFNPVSVLTQGTLVDLATDQGTRRVIRAMMEEARAVGEALGVTFAVDAGERMDMAAKVGAHRTSMLQDVEAGRPTELDALLGVVIELASLVGIGTPSLQLVYDLCKFRCRKT